jgi:hypothetical protein
MTKVYFPSRNVIFSESKQTQNTPIFLVTIQTTGHKSEDKNMTLLRERNSMQKRY